MRPLRQVQRGWLRLVAPLLRLAVSAALAIGLPVAVLGAVALADPEEARADAPPELHDIRISLRVRKALSADPELGRYNVGVTLRQGTATLWGVLPSDALVRRAVARAQQVQGVLAVKSELRVAQTTEPKLDDKPPDLPAVLGTPKPSRHPGLLTGEPRPGSPPGPGVSLLAPVPANDPPAAILLPRPLNRAAELTAAVMRLREGDVRFRLVQVEVRDRAVLLSGVVARQEDIVELARLVSRLPGVGQVVVENVRAANE